MSTQAVTPTINILANKTLLFMEGEGAESRHLQVNQKAGIQSVQAWIANTPTFEPAKRDGSLMVISGRSTLAPQLLPPTVDEVIAQRSCSQQEAEKIVAAETVKFNQGEYPYPAINAAAEAPAQTVTVTQTVTPPTVEMIIKAGYTQDAAEKLYAIEQAKAAAGEFPYGDKLTAPKGKEKA